MDWLIYGRKKGRKEGRKAGRKEGRKECLYARLWKKLKYEGVRVGKWEMRIGWVQRSYCEQKTESGRGTYWLPAVGTHMSANHCNFDMSLSKPGNRKQKHFNVCVSKLVPLDCSKEAIRLGSTQVTATISNQSLSSARSIQHAQYVNLTNSFVPTILVRTSSAVLSLSRQLLPRRLSSHFLFWCVSHYMQVSRKTWPRKYKKTTSPLKQMSWSRTLPFAHVIAISITRGGKSHKLFTVAAQINPRISPRAYLVLLNASMLGLLDCVFTLFLLCSTPQRWDAGHVSLLFCFAQDLNARTLVFSFNAMFHHW